MAQQAPVDVNVEDTLKNLMSKQGMVGFVIYNAEGIPIRRWEKKISSEQAIHYSSLFSDFWVVTKKVIQREIKNNDNDLETIRIRTKQYTEIIVSQVGDYTIVAIQNCRPDFKEVEEVAAVVDEKKEKDK